MTDTESTNETETSESTEGTNATTTNPVTTTEPAKTTRSRLTGTRTRKPKAETAAAAVPTPAKPTVEDEEGEGEESDETLSGAGTSFADSGVVVALRWACHLEGDKLIPGCEITADEGEPGLTESEAAERYKQRQGIYSTPHRIVCQPLE